MLRIAVTGGVACGKTLFTKRFEAMLPSNRVARFDCDAEVKVLLEDKGVQSTLMRHADECGESISSGDRLEKALLRKVLFENSVFREKVEAELHPLVLSRAESFAEELDAEYRVLVIEVPLLFEVEFPIPRDIVLVVAASAETQMERLVGERQLSETLAINILKSQMSVDEKMKRADIVLWNEGNLESFDAQVEHLSNRCISLFN